MEHPDEREFLAASLALGLLEGEERAGALRLQLRDPDFAALVGAWQARADHWLNEIAPAEIDPDTSVRIAHVIQSRLGAENSANHDDGSSVPKNWRAWALTATAASLILGVALVWSLFSDSTERHLVARSNLQQSANVAQIDGSDGALLLSALYDPSSGSLALNVADFKQPGLAPELWIIPEGGAPRSLGMIDQSSLTITLSPELRSLLVDGATMAITLEPQDGELHEAPTGEILGTATLKALNFPPSSAP
jgi:anti-sigma-K factor RskA